MSIQRQLDLFKNWSKYGKDIWCPFKDTWTWSKFRTSIVRSHRVRSKTTGRTKFRKSIVRIYGVRTKTPGLVQSLEHVW